MDDRTIVDLYWKREEKAIEATADKYGAYIFQIAVNILCDREDSKESVSDTYLKAWNSMPPVRPEKLRLYLGRLARQASVDIFRSKNRQKRRASQYEAVLDEMAELVCEGGGVEEELNMIMLTESINRWLKDLTPKSRIVFVGRYYFSDPLDNIAAYSKMSRPAVKSLLFRLRTELKTYLQKEGFDL